MVACAPMCSQQAEQKADLPHRHLMLLRSAENSFSNCMMPIVPAFPLAAMAVNLPHAVILLCCNTLLPGIAGS